MHLDSNSVQILFNFLDKLSNFLIPVIKHKSPDTAFLTYLDFY